MRQHEETYSSDRIYCCKESISIRISEFCNAVSFLFCAIDKNPKSGLSATHELFMFSDI